MYNATSLFRFQLLEERARVIRFYTHNNVYYVNNPPYNDALKPLGIGTFLAIKYSAEGGPVWI